MTPLSSFGWLTFEILWVNTLKTRVIWVPGICIMNNSWNYEKKTSNDSPTPHLPDPPLDAKIFKGLASVGRTDRLGSKPSMVRSGSGWWLNDSDGEKIISWISWPINMLPSGKLTVCELENGREQFVYLPIKKKTGDFPCLCKRLPEGNHLQKLDGLFLLKKWECQRTN